jgi:hypothetical protein
LNSTYTCPMHPEVVSDKPGRCPKCGMALVETDSMSAAHRVDDKGLGSLSWRSYIPLIVIISLITLTAAIVSLKGQFSFYSFVQAFMTGFFLVFAGFKLMDLKGFAEGYSTYDLLARKWFGYGYVYPFIELGFGLMMLAGLHPDSLLWTEFAVMTFSGLGVFVKLARREPFMCACLGTFLKVPLTYVTLVEDFGMAALALLLIFIN